MKTFLILSALYILLSGDFYLTGGLLGLWFAWWQDQKNSVKYAKNRNEREAVSERE